MFLLVMGRLCFLGIWMKGSLRSGKRIRFMDGLNLKEK